jgi:hypothetical protein
MNEKGVEALSAYDVNIAFSGDAQRALEVSKQLVSHHVAYFGEKVRSLGPEVTQLDLFAPQGEIFVAPELAPDEHLESAYDESQGEGDYGYDGDDYTGYSEAEDGRWDE